MKKKGKLILQDGTCYEGTLFGATDKSVSGEVVFNTSMTGYPEALTDPSYMGQMLVCTYPIIGNYGFPPEDVDPATNLALYLESRELHPLALIVHDYTDDYSHWNAAESLSDALERHGVVGLSGVDTRELTKEIRDHGPLIGKLVVDDQDIDFFQTDEVNLVAEVSTPEVIHLSKSGAKRVVLVDCGAKENIVRMLLDRDVDLTIVPWDYDFTEMDYDGLFISNGPGNPMQCTALIDHVRQVIESGEKPIAGICMGNQIMALAIGAKVKKMKFGHRSANQPVRLCSTDKCFITSQNHGFAVDSDTLPAGWRPYFENLNDGSNEGIIHESGRYFAVQFHPECHGGPMDTEFFFDDFIKLLNS